MAVALDSTIALLTEADFFTLRGEDINNVNVKQDQVRFLINIASQAIEDYCDRKFIKPTTAIVESFIGNRTTEYFVRQQRIASGTIPIMEYRLAQSWTALDTGSYPISVDNGRGRIWFSRGNNTFWHDEQDNWRVTYFYGWIYANIPADLKMVCAEIIIRSRLLLDDKEGLESVSYGDSSTTFNLSRLPENLRIVLNKYKRVTA